MNRRAMEAFAKIPISVGPFIQSSTGAVVPFFTDPRMVYSHPDALDAIVDEVVNIITPYQKRDGPLIVLGIAYSGVPLAMAVSRATRIPFCYLAKERKKSMGHKIIEGDFTPGTNAILLDDILGSGKTILASIAHAAEDGVKVRHVVVMYDVWPRLPKNIETKQKLHNEGITFDALFSLDAFLDFLLEKRLISREAWDVRRVYNTDPLGWNKDSQMWKKFEFIDGA